MNKNKHLKRVLAGSSLVGKIINVAKDVDYDIVDPDAFALAMMLATQMVLLGLLKRTIAEDPTAVTRDIMLEAFNRIFAGAGVTRKMIDAIRDDSEDEK